MSRNDPFKQPLDTINVGIDFIHEGMKKQRAPSRRVNWASPANSDPKLLRLLNQLKDPTLYEGIQQANERAVTRIVQSKPILVGFDKTINIMPDIAEATILYAGPSITYENMYGPAKDAAQGAFVFKGLAKDLTDTGQVARSGAITFSPHYEHDAIGSIAGVTSPDMYVHIIKDETCGNTAFTNLNEQLAKVLRFSANDQSVVDRLIWVRNVLGPLLHDAMAFCPEGIDLRLVLSQALHMGDECHNRNVTGSTLLVQALTPYMVQTGFSCEQLKEVFELLGSSDYFSGPTWMDATKCTLDAGHNVENSTVIITICHSEVEFRIRVSRVGGNHQFTGPAQRVVGPMFAGYTQEDTSLNMGDNVITETYSVGGFAMAATPTTALLVGGTVAEALNYSKEMLEIITKEDPNVTIPVLDFMGIPTSTDVLRVLETGMLFVINTAITHKKPGIGMTGAGLANPPANVFNKALKALVATAN